MTTQTTSKTGTKPGRLVLARHGKPALDRSKWISSNGYHHWWQAYEAGGLHPSSKPPAALSDIAQRSHLVLSSTRLRAVETALALVPQDKILQRDVFVEAALPAPPVPLIRLLPSAWDVFSRLFWWLGMSRGYESKAQAEARAFDAVSELEQHASGGQDVLLCAHGWFNRMMRPVLQGRGWDCVYDGRDDYWAFRIYEKRS
ncbi:MAG: histidine phosphatase family protein [Robiginitomaculum sp.]|nr:histidine phosphatase family protein [Robiginitomaculum sp.]